MFKAASCLLHGFSFGHSSWPNIRKRIQMHGLSTGHYVSRYFPTLLDFHGLPLDNRFVDTVYPTCGRTTLASGRLFWPQPESNLEVWLSTDVLRIVRPPFFHLSLLITRLFTPADSLERSLYSATILEWMYHECIFMESLLLCWPDKVQYHN